MKLPVRWRQFNTDALYCLFQEESIQRQMQKDIIVNLLKYGAKTEIQDEVRSLFVNQGNIHAIVFRLAFHQWWRWSLLKFIHEICQAYKLFLTAL